LPEVPSTLTARSWLRKCPKSLIGCIIGQYPLSQQNSDNSSHFHSIVLLVSFTIVAFTGRSANSGLLDVSSVKVEYQLVPVFLSSQPFFFRNFRAGGSPNFRFPGPPISLTGNPIYLLSCYPRLMKEFVHSALDDIRGSIKGTFTSLFQLYYYIVPRASMVSRQHLHLLGTGRKQEQELLNPSSGSRHGWS
jgi:hypothetical protein